LTKPGEPLFGAPLLTTRLAAYLRPGAGLRSLTTLRVPSNRITFSASWRGGAAEPDYRVELPVPEVGNRVMAVKDHHLLLNVEQAAPDLEGRIRALNTAIHGLGADVAVRLGLSRPFQGGSECGTAACWLMADGFFSWAQPQP
jgi:hypothetical protein